MQYMIMNYLPTLFYLREYFFPRGCGGCGEALLDSRDAFYGLCKDCRGLFTDVMTSENRCRICGKPLITEKDTCLSCRKVTCRESDTGKNELYNEWLVNLRSFFPYAGKFRAILGAYKFEKSLAVGNFLAFCLNSAIDNFDAETLKKAAWVPVPPRPGKIKKQGWDQIEYLALLLGREYRRSRGKTIILNGNMPGIPVNRCLKRLLSRSQKELNKEERKTNLKGRILCIKQPPETAILFDDVITTGATLNVCAAALLEGGAKRVYGVSLFYD